MYFEQGTASNVKSKNCWYMRTDDGPATSGWHGPIAMKQGKDNPKLVAINKKVKKSYKSNIFFFDYNCIFLLVQYTITLQKV